MTPAFSTHRVPRASNGRWAMVVLGGILLAHTVLSARLFPSFRAFWDAEQPVIMVDHAIHLYHGALGSRFLREHGTTWGYDPFFMAGYPETPVWDSSSNPSILFQGLAGGGYHPRAYKVGLLACTVLALVALSGGASAAGLRPGEVAAVTLLGGLYFWVGFPAMFWRSGLFAFTLAATGLVLALGLALRFHDRPTVARWGAVAGAGSALFFTHVTAPILVAGGGIGFLATTLRRRGWRWLLELGTAVGLAVAVNLVWLVPLWRFRGLRAGVAGFMTPTSAWSLLDFYRSNEVDGHLGLIFWLLGGTGLAVWWAEGRRTRAATFGSSAAALVALTAFGGLWGVTRTLEPFRFLVPLQFVLIVPAGAALHRAMAGLMRAVGGGGRGVAMATVSGLVVLGGLAVVLPRTFASCVQRLALHRPLVVGLRPEMRALVRWIRAETDPSARILLEDQLRLLERTDPESTHWTPLLPVLLRPDTRCFIGGLYQMAFIAHHQFASFGDFHLGGWPIDGWPPEDVGRYADQYNIGWVVCWSPRSRFRFDRLATAQRVATLPRHSSPEPIGPPSESQWRAIATQAGPGVASRYLAEGERSYAIYRLDRPHSYFLRGKGEVTALDANRIELGDVEPEDGAVVLSLHWLDTWRTDPPLSLAPEPVPYDPIPFVRISLPGPATRVVLFNGYGPR